MLFFLGLLIALAGEVGFLVVARKHGPAWFRGALFLAPVWLLFCVLNLKRTWQPVAVALIGMVMAGFGCWVAGVDFPDPADGH